jgi:hypothetical protein
MTVCTAKAARKRCSLPAAVVPLFAALLLLFGTVDHAQSQSFGRNKVRYDDFDFRTVKSDNFDVLYPDGLEDAAVQSGRLLERWNSRFEVLFDHTLGERQPVIIYENHPDFQQTNVISGLISQGVGGVTEGRQGRIVMPLSPSNAQNDHVLGHELVHGFHFDLLAQSSGGLGFVSNVPLWFIEGIAEYATLGIQDPQTAMWLRDGVAREDLPSLRAMARDPAYNPYRFGHALWAFIGHEFGDRVVGDLYKRTLQSGFGRAVEEVLEVSADELEERWHRSVERTFRAQVQRRSAPEEVGSGLLPEIDGLTISPSLSDDGRYLAFFAQPDVFSLELTVADTESGEVLGRLPASGANRHFDQLRFTESSGDFAPGGDRFAFVIQRSGDNGVAIASVPDLEIERTLFWGEVTGISHVAWHPSGEELVMAGTSAGRSDLYRVDLQDGSLAQLTDSPYTELQPSYDAEGRRLAYVTDRGPDTDLAELDFGVMKVAVRELPTGHEERPTGHEDRLIAVPGASKHINPHFSAEGRHLYMVADPDGVANVYRYGLEDDELLRMTNVQTGVSGFTDLAPALAVAGEADLAAFTVFDEREYRLRRMLLSETRGEAVVTAETARAGRITPPGLQNHIVSGYLEQPQRGLAEGSGFRSTAYDPRLRLSSVGQALVGVSFSGFGASLYGSINLSFSDLLNNHQVSTYLQLAGSVRDLGGRITYFNRDRRLGWGLGFAHTPYRSESRAEGTATVTTADDEEVEADIDQRVIDRSFVDTGQLLGSYPLSENLRVEGQSGYTRISYLREVQTIATAGGDRLFERTELTTPAPPLHLGQGALAFVGDYSSAGFTGPLDGARFRAEVDTSLGSLSIVNARADARFYRFLRPVGIALQGLSAGQFLTRNTDGLIGPLNLGAASAVRGYDPGSYLVEECAADAESCPEYERIFGSRILAARAELRLPFFGTEQLGLIPFRYLPTTLFAFADAGVAWYPDDPPSWTVARESTARIPVASIGGGARFNLLGAFVLQLYYAYPFQRPDRGGYVGLELAPGF